MKITQDPKAWKEGFKAGQRGAAPTACPYAVDDPRGLAWTSGFIEGKAKPLKIVKQPSKGE
jgi:ribosome modulation factor